MNAIGIVRTNAPAERSAPPASSRHVSRLEAEAEAERWRAIIGRRRIVVRRRRCVVIRAVVRAVVIVPVVTAIPVVVVVPAIVAPAPVVIVGASGRSCRAQQ